MRGRSLALLPFIAVPVVAVILAVGAAFAPALASGTRGWQAAAAVREPSGSQTVLTSVAATGARDAWAAGFSCSPGPCGASDSGRLAVARWAGGRWRSAPATGLPSPAPTIGLDAVVGASSADDVWVFATTAGNHPELVAYHWNGTAWARPALPTWFPDGASPLSVQMLGHDVWVFSLFQTMRHPFAARYDAARRVWRKVPLTIDPTAVTARSARNMWLVGIPASAARYAAPVSAAGVPALAPATTAGRPAAALAAGAAAHPHKVTEVAVHWNGHHWRTVPMPSPYRARGQVYIPIAVTTAGPGRLIVQGVASSRDGGHVSQGLLRRHGRHWARVALPVRRYGIDLFLGAIAQDGHGGVWIPAMNHRRAGIWLDHYSRGHWSRVYSPSDRGRRTVVDALAWIPRTRSLWGVGAAGGNHSWGAVFRIGS